MRFFGSAGYYGEFANGIIFGQESEDFFMPQNLTNFCLKPASFAISTLTISIMSGNIHEGESVYTS